MKILRFDEALDVSSVALRLHPIDVGFDLRLQGVTVDVAADCDRATYEKDGEHWYVEGTPAEVISTIEAAGYRVHVQIS